MDNNIGSQIKSHLRRKGISQKTFSERLGIPKSSLSSYLNDKREIPFVIITKMARELHLDLNKMYNISTDRIITSDDEMMIITYFRKINEKDKALVANSIINLLKIKIE